MIGGVLAVLRSPWFRGGFVVAALGAAGYAVWRQRDDIAAALGQIPPMTIAGATLVGFVFVLFTFLSWRAVLADLGSSLGVREAFGVFAVGQLGKYVPGGVWNFLAASEIAADRAVPRRRSLSAMAVSLLVSIVSAIAVAIPTLALTVAGTGSAYRWLWLALPVLALLLTPPLMNRVLSLAMRVARREPLEHPLSTRGIVVAVGWALAAWAVAGWQVWLVGTGVGLSPDGAGYLRATGAYAAAWAAGLLAVVAPAGLGVREAALVALLGGAVPNGGAVLVIVLTSRVLLTVADLVAAGLGGFALRSSTATPPTKGTGVGSVPTPAGDQGSVHTE